MLSQGRALAPALGFKTSVSASPEPAQQSRRRNTAWMDKYPNGVTTHSPGLSAQRATLGYRMPETSTRKGCVIAPGKFHRSVDSVPRLPERQF